MCSGLQSCDTKSPLPVTVDLQANALIRASGKPGAAEPDDQGQSGINHNHLKDETMNKINKTAIAIALTLGVTAAYAQPGQMHGNMEHGAQGGQHQGMQHGMKGSMQGMNHGGEKHAKRGETGGHGGHGAQSLATPEERSAMQEKMRAAKTPEERQQIASANRAEMQKRATEKGVTMPEHRGPQGHNRGNQEHKH